LKTIYDNQLNKVGKLVPLVDEDLQYDYQQKVSSLRMGTPVLKKKWWRGGKTR
jgi:hypothetical protein